MSAEKMGEDQGQKYDSAETLKGALELVDKDAAKRRGEEYIAPPTEAELIELGLQKAVRVEAEGDGSALAEETDVQDSGVTAETVVETPTVENTEEQPSFFQRVRNNVGLRAAGAAIALGVPAVTAAGCTPEYNLQTDIEQMDQRKVNEFMAEYTAEWSGGQEIPGLKVELIRPVLRAGETTSSAGTYLHTGEYHLVIPEGYSIQRLALNSSNEQVLADVWSGPLDESFTFYFRGTLAVYQDGNPNPVGSFTPHGR